MNKFLYQVVKEGNIKKGASLHDQRKLEITQKEMVSDRK